MDNDLKTEYEQCFENWRFLVTLRFTLLGFFLSLNGTAFYIVLKEFAPCKPPVLAIVISSLVGAPLAGLFIGLELRTRQLYHECIKRAEAIETLLGSRHWGGRRSVSDSGVAHRILSAPARCFMSHKNILVVYGWTLFLWLLLFGWELCRAVCG